MREHKRETHEKKSFFYSLTEDFRSAKGTFSFLVFVLALILVRSFIVSPFRIPSGSMIPTLQVGDHILAAKFSYGWSRYSILLGGYVDYFSGRIGFAPPERGDIIVFANPKDTTIDYIKRVVGLPGDTVQMMNGDLYINGEKMPMKEIKGLYKDHDGHNPIQGTLYETSVPRKNGTLCKFKVLKQDPFGKGHFDNTPPMRIKEKQYCFVGDNRDGSSDSRDQESVGFVGEDLLEAKALFIWYSLDYADIYLFKPWTWLKIPFKTRYSRFFRPIR